MKTLCMALRGRLGAFCVMFAMCVASKHIHAAPNESRLDAFKKSIVLITMFDASQSKSTVRSYGSGTIIKPDGSILTNFHVLAKESEQTLYDFFVVSRTLNNHSSPVPFCIGSPSEGKLNPTEDLAIVKCNKTLGGKNYTPNHWPALKAAAKKKAKIKPGSQIWVLGYSLKKYAAHLNVQAGLTSGWSESDSQLETPPFVRTDANISPGMSGGAAIDSDGHFLGVPTAFRNTVSSKYALFVKGKIGLIRTLESVNENFATAAMKNTTTFKVVDSKTQLALTDAFVLKRFALPPPNSINKPTTTGLTTDDNGMVRIETLPNVSYFISAPGYLPMALPDRHLSKDEVASDSSPIRLNLIHR